MASTPIPVPRSQPPLSPMSQRSLRNSFVGTPESSSMLANRLQSQSKPFTELSQDLSSSSASFIKPLEQQTQQQVISSQELNQDTNKQLYEIPLEYHEPSEIYSADQLIKCGWLNKRGKRKVSA